MFFIINTKFTVEKVKIEIGFIGCGAMGGAILDRLLQKNYIAPESIYITTGNFNTAKKIANEKKVLMLVKPMNN